MGKHKQAKEKKFDRNVEISAPILDPEIIKAIHSPPKGQRLDIRHGGFKALLTDLNSQDSTDELMPLNDNHVPSYIGISCAVSGYSGYSSYSRRSDSSSDQTTNTNAKSETPNRSRATSPILRVSHNINHVVIDKSKIHSADEERKELTEKLTASATEHRRSPSPVVPPTEDDRHHGAYVGARYCPLPPPDKLVNKHIPLLGIDDDQNPDELALRSEDEHKVEQKIASLYGDNFVEDWRESMTHKSRKELEDEQVNQQQSQPTKSPKDLVTLRPAPQPSGRESSQENQAPEVPAPDVKVLAQVDKQFLNRLLTDENPPMPKAQPISPPQSPAKSPQHQTPTPASPVASPAPASPQPSAVVAGIRDEIRAMSSPAPTPDSPSPRPQELEVAPAAHAMEDLMQQQSPPISPPMSPDSGKSQSLVEVDELIAANGGPGGLVSSQVSGQEQHIEYEIRAQSPIDNQSSPVKTLDREQVEAREEVAAAAMAAADEEQLVSFSPEPLAKLQESDEFDYLSRQQQQQETNNNTNESPVEQQLADLMITDALQQVDQLKEQHESESSSALDPLQEQPEAALDESSAANAATSESSNHDGHYYLRLLEEERSFILGQVAEAESLLAEQEADLDEDTVGRIRSAIGKANLLVNKKCKQFKELCEANINSEATQQQFVTLNDDLAGFWDMLSIQVGDIRKSFEALWLAKEHNWSSGQQQQQDDSESRGGAAGKTTAGSGKLVLSAQKDQERRERLQEHINQFKQSQAAAAKASDEAKSSDENLIDISEAPQSADTLKTLIDVEEPES